VFLGGRDDDRDGNLQVVGERSWGRQLGEGLFEFRVDRTVKPDDEIAEKLVLRVFCHAHGDRKILVLHGYDKGKSQSSRRQQREIDVARSRLASWHAIEAEKRKKPGGRGVGGANQRRGGSDSDEPILM
jgi:hypothetical protein